MESALQNWEKNAYLISDKGFSMRKEKSEAEKIQEAKECCEKFNKNPAGPLFLSVIYIIVIAIFIRPVWNHIYIDFNLIKVVDAYISGIIVLSAMTLLYMQCSNFFKGTEDKPNKGKMRITGVILLCAGILAALISGYTTDKYGWIEDEAIASLNGNLLNYALIKCTGVDIDRHNGNTYYGTAKLSDGTTRPTVVYYMRGAYRRHGVEYRIVAKFM